MAEQTLSVFIEIEAVSSRLRYLIWKKERYLEDPGRYPPPDPKEEVWLRLQLEKLLNAYPQDFDADVPIEQFLGELDKNTAKMWEVANRFVARVSNKWKTKNNMPSEEVLQRNTEEMERAKKEAQPPSTQKLAKSLSVYFQLDQEHARLLAQTISARLSEDVEFGAKESLRILDEVHAAAEKPEDTLASGVLLTSLSPQIEAEHPTFAATLDYVSTATDLPRDDIVVTTTAYFSFSEPTITYPAELLPTTEAAIVAVSESTTQAARTTQSFEQNAAHLNTTLQSASTVKSQDDKIEEAIRNDLSKTELKAEEEVEAVVNLFKYSAPVVVASYQQAAEHIKTPEKLNEFKRFLKLMALDYGSKRGINLSPVARQLLENTPLERFFLLAKEIKAEKYIPPDDSTRDSERTLSQGTNQFIGSALENKIQNSDLGKQMTQVDSFIKDLKALRGEDFSIEGVMSLAQKYLNLKKIDQWVDKNTTSTESKISVAGTRFMGEHVLGKLIPPLAPFGKLLGSLSGIQYAILDKTIGPLLLKFRNYLIGRWLKLFGGIAVTGLLLGLGVNVGLSFAFGTTTYFALPSTGAGAGAAFNAGAATLGGAAAAASSAAIAALISFLTVSAIVIMSVPIVLAFVLFIINNSAHIVPPGNYSLGSGTNVGFLPGCPASMWPVTTQQGQTYSVTQGPGGPGSHGPPGAKIYEEAIDIHPSVPSWDPNLHLIVATHPGIVTRSEKDGWGGIYIFLQDNCGGNFQTSYVHQMVNYVQAGQTVNTGDIIGVMGYTGHVSSKSPAGAHVHYAFLDTDFTWKNRSESPPFMTIPYIPKTVPLNCVGCGISIP